MKQRTHKSARRTSGTRSHKRQKRSGFTIIEVMIVLAIVGLIMLIVFLAVPALQRTARNKMRRNDVGIILAYVSEYRSNNKGQYSPSCNTLRDDWCFLRNVKLGWYDNTTLNPSVAVGENKNDVSFWNRSPQLGWASTIDDPATDPEELENKLNLRLFAHCDGNHLTSLGASPFDFAAEYTIETASGLIIECMEG